MQTQPSGVSNVARYDPTTIWLHWMTAGLIIALWVICQTGDWFPRGPLRTKNSWGEGHPAASQQHPNWNKTTKSSMKV